jgi:hypothetical protein
MTPRVTNVSALVEAEIVDAIVQWIDRVAVLLTSETARQRLQQDVYEQLHAGTIPTERVIAAADAGAAFADLALRQYAAEFIDQGRESELLAQVRSYVVRSLLRPPVAYPQGRSIADTWMRDIGIAVMVDLAAKRWRLSPTRNRTTTDPSAAYFVSLALRRKGFKLKEARVNRIYWEHNKLAARLSALIPSPF